MDKNEAIKIIRSNFPTGRKMLCEALEILIPELKESEDERIRKELKSFFDSEISDYGNVEWRNGIMYGEIVAWLEKQGENTYNKELSELLHVVICRFINNPDIPYSDREKVSKKIIPYVEKLEKQLEQIPKSIREE